MEMQHRPDQIRAFEVAIGPCIVRNLKAIPMHILDVNCDAVP